jgi:hypothetical protein
MKPIRLIIALVMLLVPLAARTLWFYQGTYQRTQPVATPDYLSYTLPKVQISTPMPAPAPAVVAGQKPVVLFDLNHDNFYFLSDVAPLTHEIEQLGGRFEVVESSKTLEDQLKYASSLAVIVPTTEFSTTEILTIQRFVERGGHLLVITDPTLNFGGGAAANPPVSSVEVANLLLDSYDITFNDDYVYNLTSNEGNFRHVIFSQFAKDPLTRSLSKVVFFSTHSIKTGQTALITGDAHSFSSLTDSGGGLITAAAAQQGKVLAIGNMTFLTNPYYQVADNQQLVMNIGKFLVSQPQSIDLAEFPHLLSRPVTLLVPASGPINQNLLSTLSTAQNGFQGLNLAATLSSKPVDGNDLVVFATMPVDKVYQSYIDPFKLVFTKEPPPTATPTADLGLPTPETSNATPEAGGGVPSSSLPTLPSPTSTLVSYVNVPGFGKFATNGLGLVLFAPGKDRNTLIFLAGSGSDLNTMAGLVSAGSLQDCIVQGQVAVCNLSGGSGKGGGF